MEDICQCKSAALVLRWREYDLQALRGLVMGLIKRVYHDLYVEVHMDPTKDVHEVCRIMFALYSMVPFSVLLTPNNRSSRHRARSTRCGTCACCSRRSSAPHRCSCRSPTAAACVRPRASSSFPKIALHFSTRSSSNVTRLGSGS